MKTYARMIEGVIAQIIPPLVDENGNEVPIESRFSADVLAQFVEYDPLQRPTPPTLTLEQLVELAYSEIRLRRQPIITVLDGLQSSALTNALIADSTGDAEGALTQKERAKVIEVAKQGLRDLTKLNLFSCETYEEMRATVGAAYAALAATLPTDIRQAFKDATT